MDCPITYAPHIVGGSMSPQVTSVAPIRLLLPMPAIQDMSAADPLEDPDHHSCPFPMVDENRGT